MKDPASDFEAQFGEHLSLSADGSVVAIGAHQAEDPSDSSSWYHGCVRVFEFVDSVWRQRGLTIYGSGKAMLGSAVAINDAGTILSLGVGSRAETYVYYWDCTSMPMEWKQMGGTLRGSTDSGRFGSAVSLNGAGTVLAVGATYNKEGAAVKCEQMSGEDYDYFVKCESKDDLAPFEEKGAQVETPVDPGAVFVYEWDQANSKWVEIFDAFGSSVMSVMKKILYERYDDDYFNPDTYEWEGGDYDFDLLFLQGWNLGGNVALTRDASVLAATGESYENPDDPRDKIIKPEGIAVAYELPKTTATSTPVPSVCEASLPSQGDGTSGL